MEAHPARHVRNPYRRAEALALGQCPKAPFQDLRRRVRVDRNSGFHEIRASNTRLVNCIFLPTHGCRGADRLAVAARHLLSA
jgi:hypothetical protein